MKKVVCTIFTTLIVVVQASANDRSASAGRFEQAGSFGPSCTAGVHIPFIANRGQFDKCVEFYASTFAGDVYVTGSGAIIYSLLSKNDSRAGHRLLLREEFVGGLEVRAEGEGKAPAKVSFFLGSDPASWAGGVPAFEYLDFGEIYAGIDLRLRAHGNNIEKIFCIKPRARPEMIRVKLNGADYLCVNDAGELEIITESGTISYTKPIAYQDIAGERKYIEVSYKIENDLYGFQIDRYDVSETLVIDPLLASTYVGGSGAEGNAAGEEIFGELDMTIGGDGNIYVTGLTESIDFPTTTGAYEEDHIGNLDLFILKFDPDLNTLLAATYLGGSGIERFYYTKAIVTDEFGYVYVTGSTQSSDFPTSTDAYDRILSGTEDVFVSRLSADLTILEASTYLGGSSADTRTSIALDEGGNVFVAGITYSTNFPCPDGAFDQYYAGTCDLFVSKFDANLSTLLVSTYLGGTYREDYPSICIDDGGNVVVSGATASENYPVTPNAYDTSFNGPFTHGLWDMDVCVSKLDNSLSTMLASTFIGGNGYESGLELTRDSDGNIFVAGHTSDANYPVTEGALDQEFSGDEYFISKLDGDLTSLLASTFTTPDNTGQGALWDLTADRSGYIYCTGLTGAYNLLTTANAYDDTYNGGQWDCYLTRIDNNLTKVIYSTYFGSGGDDGASVVAVNESGESYVVGFTNSSSDFPITPGVYDSDYNGGASDAFIAKFNLYQFTHITEGPQANTELCMGANWVDYDNDDYPDLFVTVLYGSNRLFHNNGDGTFTSVTGDVIVSEGSSTSSSWGDFDNDGDIDAYVANGLHENAVDYYYLNNGDGSFTKNIEEIIATENFCSVYSGCADYDNDGILDIFTTSWMFSGPSRDRLYHGEGQGQFTKITEGDLVTDTTASDGIIWTDYDDDNDLDLMMFKPGSDNVIYRNDEGTFSKVTDINFLLESGADQNWADYDNDGDQDLLIVKWSGENNALYENLGGGVYSKISGQSIVTDGDWATACCWGDFDNDGDLDAFVINDNNGEDRPDYFYINDGTGNFASLVDSEYVDLPGGFSCKVSAADYDRDGALDIYLVKWYEGEPNCLYKNNGNANSWVLIRPVGTNSNRSAIGTKIRILATIDGSPVWQLREFTGHTGSRTENSSEVHFGLGNAAIIDSIRIEWPSGMVDVYTDVAVNQFVTYLESLCGDADGSGAINLLDASFIISYLYKNGPAPEPEAAADADGSGVINLLDVTHLINYLYKNGAEPVC